MHNYASDAFKVSFCPQFNYITIRMKKGGISFFGGKTNPKYSIRRYQITGIGFCRRKICLILLFSNLSKTHKILNFKSDSSLSSGLFPLSILAVMFLKKNEGHIIIRYGKTHKEKLFFFSFVEHKEFYALYPLPGCDKNLPSL